MIRARILAPFALLAASATAPAQKSPEEFLGFPVGADRLLARYPQIVEYLRHLDEASEWIRVVPLGDSTLGNPLVMAIFTTPENFKWLDRYREISRRLADPRGLSPEGVETLVRDGKSVCLITCNIHSTEVASAQMAMEFAWKIATGKTPWDRERILGETIALLVPSTNPDGQILVSEWYDRWKGTSYDGGPMPWLYHHYAGHDNNRDWFMFNLRETRLVSDVYYNTWCPQIVLDEHQMGSTGPRFFVPPFAEPANPNIHPLVWRGLATVGAHLAHRLEQNGRAGVTDSALYTAWWEGASIMTPWWHHIVGALTEAASARIATPIYVEPNELQDRHDYAPHEVTVRHPNPWKGGWWRVRDIVEYELDASFALVEVSSLYAKDFLRNRARMALDATDDGRAGNPFAFLVPPGQHDPVEAAHLVEVLQLGAVEVHEAAAPFEAAGRTWSAGTFVVRMDQPHGAYAKDLLEVQRYPDRRLYPGGPPVRPYDVTGWTLGLQMGVEVVEVERPFEAEVTRLEGPRYPDGGIDGEGEAWILGTETNASFAVANRALLAGAEAFRALPRGAGTVDGEVAPGTWYFRPGPGADAAAVRAALESAAGEFHVRVRAASPPSGPALRVRRPRVGLYKPWVASMDEGWTRLLLERFAFDFRNLDNAAVQAGNLRDSVDAIVLPDISSKTIQHGDRDSDEGLSRYPPEYQGGIGKQGVEALRAFVEKGGTLVCLGDSSEFAIEKLELPVKNALAGVAEGEFLCPGAILRIETDPSLPLAFGMPREAAAFFDRSPAFTTSVPSGRFERRVVASYPARDPLLSGWLIGEERLSRRAAVVGVDVNLGRVVLIGFRAQHRLQSTGTYKFVFNALFGAGAEETKLP